MPVFFPGSNILNSTAGSTFTTGDWHGIPPEYGDLSWQAVLTASSAGATASSTVTIQVSNSTAAPMSTAVQTMALTCTTDTVASGGTLFGSTLQGAWKYIRALASLSSSTAGSNGSPAVDVYVYAGKRS